MKILAASMALALAASGAAAQHAQHAPAPRAPIAGARVVTIVARDYAFEVPDTVAAGLVELRLVNQGAELHHVQMIRLEDGKRMADLFAAMQGGGPPPAWAKDVGGPNAPAPGDTSVAALRLEGGRYALICFIPSPDGKPHVMKGMAREIVVAPARAAAKPAIAEPAADVTISLVDYDFALSKPLVAGRQVVRVRNDGKQAHEVFIARLAPGKSAADLLAWVQTMDGPPPAMPVGGTTGMAIGLDNLVTLDLEPGEYALVCFVPDAKDGKAHHAHGMVKQIRVAAAPAR